MSSAEERRNSEERRIEEQARRRASGARAAERFDLRTDADREEEDALMQRNREESVDGDGYRQSGRQEKAYKDEDDDDDDDGMETIKLNNNTSISPSPRTSLIPAIPEPSRESSSPRVSSESTRSGPPPPLPARRRPVGDTPQ